MPETQCSTEDRDAYRAELAGSYRLICKSDRPFGPPSTAIHLVAELTVHTDPHCWQNITPLASR